MFEETPHRVKVVYEFICSSRLSREGSQVSVNSNFLSLRIRANKVYRIVEVQDDGKYQVSFHASPPHGKC